QFDVRGDVLERVLVDHRAHEVSEIRHVPDSDLRDHLLKSSLELRPNRLGNVDPRNRRALLALVFITAANDRDGERIQLLARGSMSKDEILAPGFPHQPRILAVPGDVFADLLPHALKHGSRAGEVDAPQVRASQHRISYRAAPTWKEVDHSLGES